MRKLCGAAGVSLPAYRDIEVVIGAGGAPSVRLHGRSSRLNLSIRPHSEHTAHPGRAVTLFLRANGY